MTVRTFASSRSLPVWRRAAPICLSVAAHAGIGFCVLATLTPSGGVIRPASEDIGSGAILLTLAREPKAESASASSPGGAEGASRPPAVDGFGPPGGASPATTLAATPGEDALSASAPSAPSARAAMDPAAEAALSTDYQRRLLDHIRAFRRFPDDATREGAGGVVQLAFQIDRRGRVLGVSISRSSGWPSLDAAAVDTVRRAAPLPPIPAALPDAMTVTLPVEFGQG